MHRTFRPRKRSRTFTMHTTDATAATSAPEMRRVAENSLPTIHQHLTMILRAIKAVLSPAQSTNLRTGSGDVAYPPTGSLRGMNPRREPFFEYSPKGAS